MTSDKEKRGILASVFVGTSLDGFIARADGGLDWLPAGGGEPHGYDEFIASVDAIVIGRNTYEIVLGFGGWAYGKKPVFVLSSRELAPAPVGAVIEHLSGEPAEIVAQLEARGFRHLLRRRRPDDPGFSAGRSDPAAHRHARPGPDRHRHSALWRG